MRVLLVEHGANRGGLAAARSLSRAGWAVDVVGSGSGLTSRSRCVRSWSRVDYPAGGAGGLVEAVRDAVARCRSEVIMPVDETQIMTLSQRRQELGALLPYPEHAVLERATDRLEQARAAMQAGLDPPRTVLGSDAPLGDAAQPMVVKARGPYLHEAGGGWSRFETRIGRGAEARSWIAEIERAGSQAVVQEPLEGRLESMTVLTEPGGRVIAQVQQRAERIWPVRAGTSARATTVPVDPDLASRVRGFLDALGWHGLAQLQFLVGESGAQRLIDFNPRFYGSLSLAIGSGVDFPSLWAASVTGRPLPATVTGRPGVRYQWFGGDLRRAVHERRGGLVRDVGSSLRWGARAVHPIWSLRDPVPALEAELSFLRARI